jgi:hypothetical protein
VIIASRRTEPIGLVPDIEPRRAVGDKGYASKANRQAARKRGIIPVILHKADEKQRPGFFAKALYRGRARTEQASASSNASNASPYDARRRSEISHPLSHSQQASSWSNPSTPPRARQAPQFSLLCSIFLLAVPSNIRYTDS